MKKHLSVFMLLVRSSFYRVLAILGAMVLTQGIWFCVQLRQDITLYQALENVPFLIICQIALPLILVFLALPLCDQGGKMNNTLRRLAISERAVFGWQLVYNSLVYILFFAVQALTFAALSAFYIAVKPELVNHQTLFIASYQFPLFHIFLPLDNVFLWLGNLFICFCLGLCTAAFPIRQRHGKRSYTTFLMLICFLGYLIMQNSGSHFGIDAMIFALFSATVCALISLLGVWALEEESDGND